MLVWQLAPAARVVPQDVVDANGPVKANVPKVKLLELVLVRSTVFAVLVVESACGLNAIDVALKARISGTAVPVRLVVNVPAADVTDNVPVAAPNESGANWVTMLQDAPEASEPVQVVLTKLKPVPVTDAAPMLLTEIAIELLLVKTAVCVAARPCLTLPKSRLAVRLADAA